MLNPKYIYLEPLCANCDNPGEERTWCDDNAWHDDCPNCGETLEIAKYKLCTPGEISIAEFVEKFKQDIPPEILKNLPDIGETFA